jgi:heme-degrading monooxygenase HmoA
MDKHFASGNWTVKAGNEKVFVETWTKFLEWTKDTQAGFGFARLLHDEKDPLHYQSFAEWKDEAAREAWRNADGFVEHFTACKDLCTDLRVNDYEEAVEI